MSKLSSAEALALRLRGQGLLDPFESIEECVRGCICVQTQYSQSLPIAIAARTKPKPPNWFAKALEVNGPLRKTWTVRWTLHTIHENDAPLLVSALGARFYKRFVQGSTKHLGISETALRKREDRVWEVLREGPVTRKQLHDRVDELKGLPGAGWGWDVAGLAYEGRLYVSSHQGATTFVATDPPKLMEEEQAQAELLRRYLKAYGPATPQDFARWSGLFMVGIKKSFENLESEIEWVEIEGCDGKYAVLKGAETERVSSGKPRLLAKFDPYVMSHKDKSLYLPEKLAPHVFRPAGQVEATILVDGVIRGTWRAERAGKNLTIKVEPFEAFGSRLLKQIQKEAEGVRIALGAERVDCSSATSAMA